MAPESISEVGRFRVPIEDILSDDVCRTIDSGYSWSEVLTFESGISDCNCDVKVVIAIVMCILFACIDVRIQSLRLAEVGARCGGANNPCPVTG